MLDIITTEDLRLLISIAALIPVSAGIRMFKQPHYRHGYAFLSGLLLVTFACGKHAWPLLPPILYTYMVMCAAPKHCGALAWMGVAPYLLCWHINRTWFLDPGHPCSIATGPMMWCALKLISIANCYQDNNTKDPKDLTRYQAAHVVRQLPSPLEFVSYVFGMGSMLVGPNYEYAPFKDLMELKGVWSPEATAANKPARFVWTGLKQLLTALPFFLLWLQVKFKPEYGIYFMAIELWSLLPLYKKFLSMFGIIIMEHCLLPFVWLVAESACTMSGLNLIGWDEQTREPKWGRCANVRVPGFYFCSSIRQRPHLWNMTVSAFLRNFVYERVPLMWWQQRPSDMQAAITLIVSALWHGVDAGYILFFGGFILLGRLDTVVYKLENRFAPCASKCLPWRVFRGACFWFSMAYLAVAFLLLEWHWIKHIWSQVSYLPHIVCIALDVLGRLLLWLTQPASVTKLISGDTQLKAE